jgi:KipI family sensor histidine kinase inhibitor
MSEYRVLPAGDTAVVVEFGEQIDRAVSVAVLGLARRLSESRLEGIVETVPTFRSLMVHYDPLVLPPNVLIERIAELVPGLQTTPQAGRRWRLPACYDVAIAPDLEDVASRTGLTPAQVVECHRSTIYHVYMIGFMPGMAYLGDVPEVLRLPRRSSPRLKVPAGSLAIATLMSCVYPLEAPAGWHLIGRSPVPFLQRHPRPAALLAPGDTVSFTPVSLREYEDLLAKSAAGALDIKPTNATLEAAA